MDSTGQITTNPDRQLCLEILLRLRESQTEMRKYTSTHPAFIYWESRRQAFDECYTELKGRGYAKK